MRRRRDQARAIYPLGVKSRDRYAADCIFLKTVHAYGMPLRSVGYERFSKISRGVQISIRVHRSERAHQELVRDSDFRPGDMHKRLLRLPWRDVFSTNWDTLLESARTFVTNRSYSVVRTAADVASSAPPRIIKLHGSFPSHYPFIVTEEEYRTYPRKFAPFVNTVQQAMMETVFLLIGFSGDDPNFLYWSGWVRDNMGSSAPMIYLAGWLKPLCPSTSSPSRSKCRSHRPRSSSESCKLA